MMGLTFNIQRPCNNVNFDEPQGMLAIGTGFQKRPNMELLALYQGVRERKSLHQPPIIYRWWLKNLEKSVNLRSQNYKLEIQQIPF